MDNEIDPAVGSWYRRVGGDQIFQVVAVDDDERLVEFQHFDGDIGEVSLNEWRNWDLEVTAAPEDWTGPIDEIRRGDLGYTETRSEGERRGLAEERRRQAMQDAEIPDSEGSVGGWQPPGGAAETEDRPEIETRADGLNRREINRVKARLTERREELRLDIQRELRKYDDESYTELAQRVADSGEQAWSDLVSDLNLAEITRDVGEVRDLKAAFGRLAEGKYGICMACGVRIDRQRLDVYPAAVRCVECQREHETRGGEDHYHTL